MWKLECVLFQKEIVVPRERMCCTNRDNKNSYHYNKFVTQKNVLKH